MITMWNHTAVAKTFSMAARTLATVMPLLALAAFLLAPLTSQAVGETAREQCDYACLQANRQCTVCQPNGGDCCSLHYNAGTAGMIHCMNACMVSFNNCSNVCKARFR
jgi:hypothetical protein